MQGEKGTAGTRRQGMDMPRQHTLADAGLAFEQDRQWTGCDLGGERQRGLHRRGLRRQPGGTLAARNLFGQLQQPGLLLERGFQSQ
jgi:hypothetical protein